MKKIFVTYPCILLLALILAGCNPYKLKEHTSSFDPWNISFTPPRAGHTSVVNNGYLYILGGNTTNSTYLNTVQFSRINSDGKLGSWYDGNSFTNARTGHTSLVNSGNLYLLGGYGNDVQYARFDNDGTIGSWKTTTSFSDGRKGHTSVVYNDYVYVLGGHSGTAYLNDVQYATLISDGSIWTFGKTTSFSTGRSGHASFIYNGYIYVTGGFNGTYLSNIQYTTVNSNGSLGTWTSSPVSLPGGRSGHTAAVYNGYLYIIGGYDGSEYLNDVKYAKINSDGSIGSFSSTEEFLFGRSEHSSIIYNGYLYILGGLFNDKYGKYYLCDIQYAEIKLDRSLSEWEFAF